MSAPARSTVAGHPAATRALALPLAGILAVGLAVRLVLLPSLGFHNDVSAFEAWTLQLKDSPPWQFYAKTTFADYPPGYFLVLWGLGWFYGLLSHLHLIGADPTYLALRLLVKLPALVMDLLDAVLIFAIVRRYAAESVALGAAALFALNPATIYVSAYWGQIDSVSWGFVLLAAWLALRSEDDPRKSAARLGWAWVAMAFSILIKPQGALVALVLAAFAFASGDAAVRRRRLTGTAIGIGAGLLLAYAVSALFHGTLDPVADAAWLFGRYVYGSAVYPYNTINAFNLYAIKQPFWQPDTGALPLFGIPAGPIWAWGVALVLASAALIVARYLQRRDDQAFLEAAMLVAFAFFTLATRMHERYVYGAFLLAFPLIAFGRRYAWAAILLSITTLLNLIYSFAYQGVMEAHPAGVDPTNLWPIGSHVVAAVNVALFFGLGYLYLGGRAPVVEAAEHDAAAVGARARSWFDPREGIASMKRRDWLLAGLLTLASFVLCVIWIQWPAEKIFDEIYYARAGEEYLKHVEIFEFTHPPLTKLIITLSMLLFGGLHGGDDALGWRFLNVVIGALMVLVVYLFAKRLLRSTAFAVVAAGMLLFDGFHFVQSRIATPEITVAFFSICTLYAFYRVWTASAVRRAVAIDRSRGALVLFAAIVIVGAVVAAAVATAAVTLGPSNRGPTYRLEAWFFAFAYVETIFYLGARWATSGGREVLRRWFGRPPVPGAAELPLVVSYADGTRIVSDGRAAAVAILPEGQRVPLDGAKSEQVAKREDGPAMRCYLRDGRLIYATPAATAEFAPAGRMAVDGVGVRHGEMWLWLAILGLFSGALGASKWNGLFDFWVVWFCVAGVVGQRLRRRPALYGNPFGMPLDVVVGGMFVISGTIYTLCYIPFFSLGHNFVDLMALQNEMYNYHAHLIATHPYASKWWQWPILGRPISYYYHDWRTGAASADPNACCVAEILALPNPFVWWFGLITVPAVAVLAWLERNRGYTLLIVAYLVQWLPWMASPRLAFEYHFFPNLAIIVLCNAVVLQRLWNWTPAGAPSPLLPRLGVGTYLVVVVAAFAFFYPVLVGQHITWNAWHARMWTPNWI